MIILKKIFWLFFLIVCCFFSLQSAYALDSNIENQYLLTLHKGNVGSKTVVAKKITQSFIVNDEIFKEVERQLLMNYNNTSNHNQVDQMAWFCKVLASSGQSKYLKSVQQVAQNADNDKLQRYAKQSISLFSFHAKRNSILSSAREYVDKGFDVNSSQLAVLLKSDDYNLKRDATKKIIRADYVDSRLFDIVEQELIMGMKNDNSGKSLNIDTMSWMCKALSASGDKKYEQTLQMVVKNTSSPKLQRNAENALGNY